MDYREQLIRKFKLDGKLPQYLQNKLKNKSYHHDGIIDISISRYESDFDNKLRNNHPPFTLPEAFSLRNPSRPNSQAHRRSSKLDAFVDAADNDEEKKVILQALNDSRIAPATKERIAAAILTGNGEIVEKPVAEMKISPMKAKMLRKLGASIDIPALSGSSRPTTRESYHPATVKDDSPKLMDDVSFTSYAAMQKRYDYSNNHNIFLHVHANRSKILHENPSILKEQFRSSLDRRKRIYGWANKYQYESDEPIYHKPSNDVKSKPRHRAILDPIQFRETEEEERIDQLEEECREQVIEDAQGSLIESIQDSCVFSDVDYMQRPLTDATNNPPTPITEGIPSPSRGGVSDSLSHVRSHMIREKLAFIFKQKEESERLRREAEEQQRRQRDQLLDRVEMRRRVQEFRRKLLNRLKEKNDPHLGSWMRRLDDAVIIGFIDTYKGYTMSIDAILSIISQGHNHPINHTMSAAREHIPSPGEMIATELIPPDVAATMNNNAFISIRNLSSNTIKRIEEEADIAARMDVNLTQLSANLKHTIRQYGGGYNMSRKRSTKANNPASSDATPSSSTPMTTNTLPVSQVELSLPPIVGISAPGSAKASPRQDHKSNAMAGKSEISPDESDSDDEGISKANVAGISELQSSSVHSNSSRDTNYEAAVDSYNQSTATAANPTLRRNSSSSGILLANASVLTSLTSSTMNLTHKDSQGNICLSMDKSSNLNVAISRLQGQSSAAKMVPIYGSMTTGSTVLAPMTDRLSSPKTSHGMRSKEKSSAMKAKSRLDRALEEPFPEHNSVPIRRLMRNPKKPRPFLAI
jgi:hypothetical protein